MKTLAILALVAGLSGCTTNSSTTAQNTPAPRTFGEKRVYSADDLAATGKTSPARQLERLDPAITARGPGE
ncbi:MAG: hypothetical protein ACR2HH_10840 [Chthoniobacterales bacterium]